MSEPSFDEELDQLAGAHVKRTPTPEGTPVPHQHAWLLVMAAALAAGLIAFGIGEMIYKIIPAEKVLQSVMMTSAKVMLPTPATLDAAAARNGALTFGVLGLCLGGALGIAGGMAHRSTQTATRGGLVGAVLGLALGVGLSLGCLPWLLRAQNRYSDDDLIVLIVSLLMHALIWGLIGASAGLAFTVGLAKPRLWHRSAIAGFLGAVAGTVVFELAGGLLFPLAATHQPISETWQTRLMARLLVALATGGAVTLVFLKPERKTAATGTKPTTTTIEP